MLGALIRYSFRGRHSPPDDAAFDTATFTLSTEVPRPDERRVEQRLLSMLPMARLVAKDSQDLCRVRNISAAGLLVETLTHYAVGMRVRVEFNSHQQVPGEVVWTRDTSCGIKFDRDIDLREMLANRPARRKGQTPRPPRLDISCNAELTIEGVRHRTNVQDISLGGLKVALNDRDCTGKAVTVRVESLRPVKGVIRWHKNGRAGIIFNRALSFEELAEWIGKRVEVATLKAGAWTR